MDASDLATVPLPAQGPGGYSRGHNSSAQERETTAVFDHLGNNVQFIEHFPLLYLMGTLRPLCEVSRVGTVNSDTQIEEREAQEDEVTALGPPSWGEARPRPLPEGEWRGGPRLERRWPKPQLARLGKPVLK